MKFATYQRAVQPSTINSGAAKVSGNSEAYGISKDTSATEAGRWKDAFGEMAKTAVKIRDDEDAASVLEARNKIMNTLSDKLNNPENGLWTMGIGENAKGLSERTNQAINDTFEEISGNYNARVRKTLQANMNDYLQGQYRQSVNQEVSEIRKIQAADYESVLKNNTDYGITSWQERGVLTSVMNDNDRTIRSYAERNGWSEAQIIAEQRKRNTELYSGAIATAISAEDMDRAREIFDNGKRYMDADSVMKLQAELRKNQQEIEMDTFINNLPRDSKGNIDIVAADKMIDDTYGVNAVRTIQGNNDGAGKSNQRLWNIAVNVSKKTNINPDFIYGQMMHESARGEDPVALENSNFSGMHGGAAGRHYASDDEFAEDYAKTLNAYDGLKEATTATDFVQALKRGGYFTSDDVDGYIRSVDQYGNEGKRSYNIPTQSESITAQVENLKPEFKKAISGIGHILADAGVLDSSAISSAARSVEHNRGVNGADYSYHIDSGNGGDALDIVFDDNVSQEQIDNVVSRFKASGAFEEVLYHDAGSGLHLHLGGYKGGLETGNAERTISAYDPKKVEYLRSRIRAKYNDEQARKREVEKEQMKAWQEDIRSAGSYEGAIAVIHKNSDSMDAGQEHDLKIFANSFYAPKRGSSGTTVNEYGWSKQEARVMDNALNRANTYDKTFMIDGGGTMNARSWAKLDEDVELWKRDPRVADQLLESDEYIEALGRQYPVDGYNAEQAGWSKVTASLAALDNDITTYYRRLTKPVSMGGIGLNRYAALKLISQLDDSLKKSGSQDVTYVEPAEMGDEE